MSFKINNASLSSFGDIHINQNTISSSRQDINISPSGPGNVVISSNLVIKRDITSGSDSENYSIINVEDSVNISGTVSAKSFLALHEFQCFPENSVSFISAIDPANDVNYDEWFGGVLAPNGKIYGIPHDSNNVLVIDPVSNTVSFINTGKSGNGKWFGCVLAPNGKIYGIPYNSNNVLVIDPVSNTVSFISVIDTSFYTFIGQTYTRSTRMWSGGVLAPNGKIYGIPFGSLSVLVIDPVSNTVSFISAIDPGDIGNSQEWNGGVLAPNGKIYGIPYISNNIIVIDPVSNTVSFISGVIDPINEVIYPKWVGGVLAPNGKIYGIPYDSKDILVIDHVSNTVSFINIFPHDEFVANSRFIYSGGVLAPNGKIYGIPSFRNNILVIDPDNENEQFTSINTEKSGYFMWMGGVLAPNGKIYGIPRRSNEILVISTGLPVHPPWMLQAYFNKF